MQTKRDTTIQDKQIDFLAHMLDEAMEDKAGAPLRESVLSSKETLEKIVDAVEEGRGIDEIRTILRQDGLIDDEGSTPRDTPVPRQKNATGEWYVVYSSDTVSMDEYDRIAAGEIDDPADASQDEDSTAYGPFPSAYDANLYWWKEFGRDDLDAITANGIDDFDDYCAEKDLDPDEPQHGDWIDNGDADPRDWCRYKYEVVSNRMIPWFRENRNLTFERPSQDLRESGILLNVDDPSDAAKIGGKQNAKGVIVKYNGKFHVVTRYDYVSGRLWLYDRAFDTEAEAYDYRDYLNSHGEY